jgi:DNA-nicking Smr family endonuclease
MSKKSEQKRAEKNSPFAALRGLRDELTSKAEAAAVAAARGQAKPALPAAKVAPKVTPKSKGGSAGNDGEDATLSFARMMQGVVPLAKSDTAIEAGQAFRERLQRETYEAEARFSALVVDAIEFEVEDDGRTCQGRRTTVPPELLRRLKRGVFPIDATLDLHGETVASAREKVIEFLRRKRSAGERCVCIVHGKGSASRGGTGVLRGELGAWLSQGPSKRDVAAFATAPASGGGEGAVLVILSP